jgi:hypothetical protein
LIDTDYGRRIVGDGSVVEQEARGALEDVAPVGKSILDWICEDGSEGVDPTDSVVWDDHQNGK